MWSRLICILACIPVLATTYYVDPDAGSNANAGTSTGAAWQTPPGTSGGSGAGWATLAHGDVLIVKGGTSNLISWYVYDPDHASGYYNGNSAYDSIIIRSGHLHSPTWGTGRAVIDGESTRTWGVLFQADGITFDGFEVRNIAAGTTPSGEGNSCLQVGNNSLAGTRSYITIKNCYLHDSIRDADDRGHGIEFDGSTYSEFLIEKNQIGPNIGTKGIEVTSGNHWGRIRQNYIYDCGDHEVVIDGHRIDFYGNLVMAKQPWVHEPRYCVKTESNSGQVDLWNNVVFLDLTTYSSGGLDSVLGIGLFDTGQSNRVFHNTVFQMRGQSANHGSSLDIGGDAATTNHIVKNNLFIGAVTAFAGQEYSQLWMESDSTANTFSYNDWYGTASGQDVIILEGPTAYTVAEWEGSPGGNIVSNNQQSDPVFTGGSLPSGVTDGFVPNTSYFTLQSSSPSAVKATGNSLSGTSGYGYSETAGKFSADIIGNSRSSWSMGAYEYNPGGLPSGYSINVGTLTVGTIQ